jgi:uncharacterized membrane protein
MIKITSLVFLAFLLLGSVSAQTNICQGYANGMMSGFYGGMMGSYGYGGAIFSWLISLLVIVALVLLIYWLIQKVSKNPSSSKA